ncbi:MAG TPA: GNAT family N-acetyltransferase [Victivallales bacterium]|nr:GNAT family N-acetyltransferase [Victivallales bacterium]
MIKIVKKNNEIKKLVDLAKEIWEEHYTKIIGTEQVNYMLDKFQSTEAVIKQINEEGYLYYLITKNSESVGYIGVIPKRDELYLSKCYIKSTERRKSFGRIAMDYIVDLCKEKKLKRITLNVNKNNSKSIAAYKKLNFKIIDSVINDIGNSFVMDDYIMEKKI